MTLLLHLCTVSCFLSPQAGQAFTPPDDNPYPRRTAGGSSRLWDGQPVSGTWEEEQRRREEAIKFKPIIA